MAYYAYKAVRDLLPEHIIEAQGPDYEGDGNYDGDQWYAAEDYILELIQHRAELLKVLMQMEEHFRGYQDEDSFSKELFKHTRDTIAKATNQQK